MNDDSNYEKDYYNGDESYMGEEDKELIEFINEKTRLKKSLLKYREKYNRRRNHLIILDDDEDISGKKSTSIPLKESSSPEKEKKRFKRLKKISITKKCNYH